MLQNIRDNSQGWIAKTIIGVIIALLALTGFDAIFNATSNRQSAAEVNGEEISLDQLNEAMNLQRRQLQQQLGQDFDASLLDENLLRDAALKGLIERKLLLQGAEKAGFRFSQAAIDQLILQTPEFQVDGKFNADRFDQVIRQMNYSRLQFRQMLEQEMLIGQLRAGLAGSGFVTDAEVQAFARLEKQTRDFATLTLKADPAAIQVSAEEIKAYYDGHADQFKSPEQVVVEYVELKKSAFFDQVEAKEEDLQAQYQKEISNLAEQRHAAHILVEVSDKLNEEQAKAKIDQVKQRLEKGEDFSALAKEFSDDSGSAADGGDLGFAGPGVYEPAFEESLYALKDGEVSAPVRTQYGWHLIKLLGVQAPEVPSFESLKPKLEQDLKAQQVEQRFVEVSKELEDAAFEASDLAQPAQELGLDVKTSAPFGREGGEGITANRQVLQAAFSTEVLEDGANSSAIELDPDTVVVLRVKEHKKPEQLELDKVSDSIRQHLVAEKAADAVKAKGEALMASLREGKTPIEQAQDGQAWQVVEAATRSQEGVEPVLLQTLFRMPKPTAADKPEFAGVKLNNGDYVVIRLNGVNQSDAPLSEQEKAMYSRFLASRSGQQDFSAFRRQLEEAAKIERF
ncbi:SurA N-terminal domain-containing protein [Metapseudomonas furukawaii]|uniref:Periplasmic chaperone PpiD n=1 Tax=Metapseudomonas furukawaii TaxID=1149133 RepID=A0AAD1BZ44_METFU|nr:MULTISPECIES: SurA N-terminal domain-containing protein [Pseudomonas]ELS28926.1 Peptidyl-prolyl cis-trans isomerase ppiD [Pseudomonas furukawaii]OWJ94814.1 peptidylprolyl isomerase [Pseudomonas sp. A46]WAG80861.1 SurA N-terminal domain-containing protein [Pseudomonas furukawaii]BAU73701.1 peptidyl-prolyl cis-trans isomerase PpiD [Pseudomonas furukawaii]